MRILVIGATGALGQDVLAAAVAQGHDTGGLVRDAARAALPAGVETVEGDVLDATSLERAVRRRDALISVLGTPSPRQASTLLRDGTENIVSAMRREHVRRLVCVTLLGVGVSRANTAIFYREVV